MLWKSWSWTSCWTLPILVALVDLAEDGLDNWDLLVSRLGFYFRLQDREIIEEMKGSSIRTREKS